MLRVGTKIYPNSAKDKVAALVESATPTKAKPAKKVKKDA